MLENQIESGLSNEEIEEHSHEMAAEVKEQLEEEKPKKSFEMTLREWSKEPRHWEHTPEQDVSLAHYWIADIWPQYSENPISIRNDLTDPEIVSHCLQHERGHSIDYEGLRYIDIDVHGGKLSRTDEWLRLGDWTIEDAKEWPDIRRKPKRISNLCGIENKILGGVATHPAEEFAEAYSQRIADPEEFEKAWPERARFLEENCSHVGIVKRALKSGELTPQQAIDIHKDAYPDIENWPEYTESKSQN